MSATLDLLMSAVCIALGEDSNAKWKPKDPSDPGKGKEQDFWEYAKKAMLNSKLISKIQSYKEEKIKNMNPKSIQRLKTLCVILLNQRHIPIYWRQRCLKSQSRLVI